MDKGLKFQYDEHSDILYISLDKPQPAISDEIEDGILLRRDPKTHQAVGLTILNFRTLFLKKPKNLPLMLQPV